MGLRVGGIQTGLDTNALVDALISAERRPLDLVERQKSELESHKSLFRDLNSRLLALREAAAALDNRNSTLSAETVDEELLSFTASSSDPTVVTARASGNASPGPVDVHVSQLASVGRRVSAAFADPAAVVANAGETLQIDYGGDDPILITVGAGGASLENLRDAINGDENNDGSVRASILFDGTNHRLIVSGAETGAANDVVVTTTISGPAASPFVDASLTQNAADASFEVFGVAITRASNDVDDVLPGLTLHLHGTSFDPLDPADVTTIDVARDDEAIAEKVQAFVSAYNAVIDFISTQSAYDEATETAGPLSGDPTLRGIQTTIQSLIVEQFSFTGNPFTSLGQIGIEVGRNGRLSLDGEALSAALGEDPFAVRELLAGDGTEGGDGAALALARAIDPLTQSGDGTLALRNDALEDQIEGLERQIERFEARLERREELLVLQFSRLESTVAALQSQGNSLLGLFNVV